MQTPDLQPLGVGEIFDRAITLFVRRFAPLALILAVIAAPAAILHYIGAPANVRMLADFQKLVVVPPGHPEETAAILRRMSEYSRFSPASMAAFFFAIAVGPLAATACAIAAARGYLGRVVSVRDAYREALRRWIPQLVVGVVFIAAALVVFVLIFVATFALTLIVVALAAVSRIAALVIGIPLVLAAVIAVTAFGMLLYLAWQLAFVAAAIEDPNPVTAIASGFRRTFAKPLFWRSLLIALIVFAVSVAGTLVVVAVASTVAFFTHVYPLYPIIVAIGNVLVGALLTTFVVVYWFDVRVRREGFDLSLAAQPHA